MKKGRITAITLIVLSMLLMGEICFACTCAYTPVSDRFDRAEFAFSAEVIAVEIQIDPEAKYRSTMDKVKITLGPRQEYKKDSSQLEFLYTFAGGASCGVSLSIGQSYTFFVGENGFVSLCGSTVRTEELEEFYDLLVERSLVIEK
jgi:hypothetical protein